MKKFLPAPDLFIGTTVPGFPSYTIVEEKGAGGNGRVFRAHSAENQNDIACKLIPMENVAGEHWRDELRKPNQLRSPGIVRCIEATRWETDAFDCLLICSEYVPGHSLKQHIRQNRRQLPMIFVERFLRFILPILKELGDKRYAHGDLHAGNVLVEDRSDILGSDPYAFRLTDFSCTVSTSGAVAKDDYLQTALVLREILENVDDQAASARDHFVFDQINDRFLGKYLLDADRTRDRAARNPAILFELVIGFDAEWNALQASKGQRLLSPFDYLSCEQIGGAHHLLKSLYSEQFLGLSSIEERNNIVMTGPRGCGKSTVFRSLSLRHRTLVGDDQPSTIDYIGVYYRCDDLYYAFPRYRIPDNEEALNIPLHYATATLLVGLLDAVEQWSQRHFSAEFERVEGDISRTIWKVLGVRPRIDLLVSQLRC